MSDFDDLRRILNAQEDAEALARKKKIEGERRQAEAAWTVEDRKRLHENRLNGTVIEILEALRDAVYPGCEVQGWAIGYTRTDTFPYSGEFVPWMHVVLEFDKRGEPRRFRIDRDLGSVRLFKSVRCGLTGTKLIGALKTLHPPDIIRQVSKLC
jgi:hypothetical protein